MSPRRAVGWPMLCGPGRRHARSHGHDSRAGVLRAIALSTRLQVHLRDEGSLHPFTPGRPRSACTPPGGLPFRGRRSNASGRNPTSPGSGPLPDVDVRTPSARPADARPGRRGVRQPRLRRIVIHSFRHRLGLAAGHPAYASLEGHLRTVPPITVPAVTLDGLVDGNFPATDGSAAAAHFTGPRVHHHIRAPGRTFLRKHRRRSPRPSPRCSPSPHSRRRRHREPLLPAHLTRPHV